MKTKLLATILLLFTLQLLAQNFAPVGAEWYYSEGYAFSGDEGYLHILCEKDTLVQGIECRKLVQKWGLGCSVRPKIEFIYSVNDTVFFWDDTVGKFQILYDFNAEKGSTWNILQQGLDMGMDTLRVFVDSTSQISINNNDLKILYVSYHVFDSESTDYSYTYKARIIETIGDVYYLFNLQPIENNIACDGNYSMGLRCYEDPKFGIYSTGISESCNYTYDWFEHVFGSTGTEWYYNGNNGGAAPSESEYLFYKSVKDTVILGNFCYKITRSYHKYNGTIKSLPPYYVAMGANYVQLYNPIANKFDLLYNFNVAKGDTVTLDIPYELQEENTANTFRLVIDSVASEVYNGVTLKKFKIRPIDGFGWMSEWYMEKVGSLDWFIPRGVIAPEEGGPLRCYHDFNIDINFVGYDCDYQRVSIADSKNKDIISVSPNPCTRIIDIKTQNSKPLTLEVCDVSGRILLQSTIESSRQMDISSYLNGTYLFILKDGNEILGSKKVVKN